MTRIACFKFRSNVTAEQKGDRTRAFLDLYDKSSHLILEMPRGGRPLDTPLNLTDVKREAEWDTLFVVKFKVCKFIFGLIGLRSPIYCVSSLCGVWWRE